MVLLKGHSPAAMASLRAELVAKKMMLKADYLTFNAIREMVQDHLPAAIETTRHYQTLQALVHCSRRSLLPNPNIRDDQRAMWDSEIKTLEAKGIR
jgi:hypothetical protein